MLPHPGLMRAFRQAAKTIGAVASGQGAVEHAEVREQVMSEHIKAINSVFERIRDISAAATWPNAHERAVRTKVE